MQLVADRYDYQVTRNCNFSDQNGQSCQEICKCNNFQLFTINGHKFSLKMVYFIYPSRFQGHFNFNSISILSIWLASNKLTLNIDKSHFVIFHRARLKQNTVNISLCDISLNRVNFTKFLGVIIDDKLSFSRHISYIKNKISKGMGIIIKARKYLNRKSLLDLYHAFVYPYLTYCIEVWGNMSNVHLDALVKIQKKIVRIITYSPYLAHTDELFKELNILPIHKLMLQRVALQMFKYSINILPLLANCLSLMIHSILIIREIRINFDQK